MIRISELQGSFFPEFRLNQMKKLEQSWNYENGSLTTPMNMKIWGPPGTGKTHSVKYYCQELEARYKDYKFICCQCARTSIYELWIQILNELSMDRQASFLPSIKQVPSKGISPEQYAQRFKELFNMVVYQGSYKNFTFFLDEFDTLYRRDPENIKYLDDILYILTDDDALIDRSTRGNIGVQFITVINSDIFAALEPSTRSRIAAIVPNNYPHYNPEQLYSILEKKIECSGLSDFIDKRYITDELVKTMGDLDLDLRWAVKILTDIAYKPNNANNVLNRATKNAVPERLNEFFEQNRNKLIFHILREMFYYSDNTGRVFMAIRQLHRLWNGHLDEWISRGADANIFEEISWSRFYRKVLELRKQGIIEIEPNHNIKLAFERCFYDTLIKQWENSSV